VFHIAGPAQGLPVHVEITELVGYHIVASFVAAYYQKSKNVVLEWHGMDRVLVTLRNESALWGTYVSTRPLSGEEARDTCQLIRLQWRVSSGALCPRGSMLHQH
jgi:hypothetical protein